MRNLELRNYLMEKQEEFAEKRNWFQVHGADWIPFEIWCDVRFILVEILKYQYSDKNLTPYFYLYNISNISVANYSQNYTYDLYSLGIVEEWFRENSEWRKEFSDIQLKRTETYYLRSFFSLELSSVDIKENQEVLINATRDWLLEIFDELVKISRDKIENVELKRQELLKLMDLDYGQIVREFEVKSDKSPEDLLLEFEEELKKIG
jgi:hypothetical protein